MIPIATAQLIIALVGLILEKGLPAASQLMANWDKEEIGLDDIKALHNLVQPPEDY